MTESVTSRDLRAMLDMIDAGYQDTPGEGLPSAVAEGLGQLVPCDSISFFELDPGHRHCGGHGCVHKPELTPAFWLHYWACPPCSYPERTGDFRSVRKVSDYYSQRQWHSSPMYSEYLRHFGVEHELIVCLPTVPGGRFGCCSAESAETSANETGCCWLCSARIWRTCTGTPSGAGPVRRG